MSLRKKLQKLFEALEMINRREVLGYVIKDGNMIPLALDDNLLSEYEKAKGIHLSREEKERIARNSNYHYMLLEILCDIFHIPHLEKSHFKGLEGVYGEYLVSLLCKEGMIVYKQINEPNRVTVSGKAKYRYEGYPNWLRVPVNLEVLNDQQRAALEDLKERLEEDYLYIFASEYDEFGKVKKIVEYPSTDALYDAIDESKKTR